MYYASTRVLDGMIKYYHVHVPLHLRVCAKCKQEEEWWFKVESNSPNTGGCKSCIVLN